MSGLRYILALVLAATVTGVGIGVALAAARRPSQDPPELSGMRLYALRSVRTFQRTRRIEQRSMSLELVHFVAHGGQAEIDWYCGAWSPLRPRGGSEVSLFIDGDRIASAFLNGSGSLSARPGLLRWVGSLRAGTHVIEVRLENARGGVAMPLVRPSTRVPEGLTIEEYVPS